ncbi:MAG: hypothetical protein ABFS24_07655 [Pseudomonadota bacterium]
MTKGEHMKQSNLYIIFAISIFTTNLVGCSSTPVATTPLPKEELISLGQDSSKGGSYEIALNNAQSFCNRWGAAPSIISKEVSYQGQLQEDTNTAINVATDIAIAAGNWIPRVGSSDAYETKITYKCY